MRQTLRDTSNTSLNMILNESHESQLSEKQSTLDGCAVIYLVCDLPNSILPMCDLPNSNLPTS